MKCPRHLNKLGDAKDKFILVAEHLKRSQNWDIVQIGYLTPAPICSVNDSLNFFGISHTAIFWVNFY